MSRDSILLSLAGLRDVSGWSGFSGGYGLDLGIPIDFVELSYDFVSSMVKALLHDSPSRIVPQHWSGKEQGINAIQHASVARQKRS